MKTFKCGLCKAGKEFIGFRKIFRKHLQKEHRIMKNLANIPSPDSLGLRNRRTRCLIPSEKTKQSWWNENL